MPTEMEIRVMKLLSAIEIPPQAAQTIESWGNEAVTVACDTALGTFPGLRPKVRNNAVALVGRMTAPQAMETLPLLITDANTDVAIRAIRAASHQKNTSVTALLGQILRNPASSSVVAAEAVKALRGMGTSEADAILQNYRDSSPSEMPHRGSPVVLTVLRS